MWWFDIFEELRINFSFFYGRGSQIIIKQNTCRAKVARILMSDVSVELCSFSLALCSAITVENVCTIETRVTKSARKKILRLSNSAWKHDAFVFSKKKKEFKVSESKYKQMLIVNRHLNSTRPKPRKKRHLFPYHP